MVITIDIGNTSTGIAVFIDNSLTPIIRDFFNTNKSADLTAIKTEIQKLSKKHNIKFDEIEKVCIDCVVPNMLNAWESAIKEINQDIEFVICNAEQAHKIPEEIYNCVYAIPEEVGGDIISAVIAAKELYGCPTAIIDFGTATNINIINNKGEFIGAVIAPGIQTSLNGLVEYASALKDVEIKANKFLIGKNTPELIQSGLVHGEAAKADGIIDRIQEEIGYEVNVICTGGFAEIISPLMKHKNELCPDLLHIGLKIFSDYYAKH